MIRRRRESDVSWSLGADYFFSLFSMSEYRGVLLLANFDPPFVISVFGFHFLQMICLFGGSGPAPLVTCNVGHIHTNTTSVSSARRWEEEKHR